MFGDTGRNMKSVYLCIVLLLAGTVWAETLPDAPDAQARPTESSATYQTAPPAAGSNMIMGLRARSEKPVADRTFKIANAAMFAAGIANVELAHQSVVSHSCTLPQLPSTSRAALYGMARPANFATSFVAYKLKQHGHRWWFVAPAAVTAAQLYSAGHMIHRMNP
jgi:hypothetical protein